MPAQQDSPSRYFYVVHSLAEWEHLQQRRFVDAYLGMDARVCPHLDRIGDRDHHDTVLLKRTECRTDREFPVPGHKKGYVHVAVAVDAGQLMEDAKSPAIVSPVECALEWREIGDEVQGSAGKRTEAGGFVTRVPVGIDSDEELALLQSPAGRVIEAGELVDRVVECGLEVLEGVASRAAHGGGRLATDSPADDGMTLAVGITDRFDWAAIPIGLDCSPDLCT